MGFPNGDSIYRVLSLVCHQLPSRSFWLFGFPCGLCSRCLLGYIGIAVAALFIRHPRKYSRRFLLGTALLVPGIVDGLIQLETNYESANLMRAITGLIGGMGLFMLLYPLGFQNSLIKKGVSSMKFLSTPPRFWFLIVSLAFTFFLFSPASALARQVVLKESILVPVQTKTRISSKDAIIGTQVILSVERDIKVDGVVVIKAEAPVLAVISDAKKTGMAGISGEVHVNIEYVTAVDGTKVPLRGSFNTRGDSEIGGTIAVGVILCPLAFLNKGKEGVIPAGAVIRTLTVGDKTIKVSDKQ